MIISIHNNQMEIVDFMSNDIPGTLKYSDEEFTTYLENGCTSTFDLTIEKFQNGRLHPRIGNINDQAYLSFRDNLGNDHLFTIRKIVEKDYTIQIESEDVNLELLNETTGKYEASTEMTFVEYCSAMQLLTYTRLEIGLNEVSTKKLKLTFNSSQTMLERILELVENFGAECEFKTLLYPNGQLKTLQLNVYEAYDTKHPYKGVGDNREEIQLTFGREITGVQVTSDKENLFNGIRLKDKNGKHVVAKKNHIYLADDNQTREAYMMRNTNTMYAPRSMMMYPSVSNVNSCDNWTVREFTTEETDYDKQIKYLYDTLKKYMYPVITYEVDMAYYQVFREHKIKVGDTIYISDKNFLNGLLFQARVSEIKICPSDSTRNTITLTNAVKIASKVDTTLIDRMKELAKNNLPYSMTLSTDNGISFKEETGQSTITPTLYKGSEVYASVDWMYFQNDTFLGQGNTYIVKALDMGTEPLTIDVQGYVDGDLRAHQQITFTKVYDGVSPIKLEIITSNGTIFKNNNIYTNLTAKVYRGDTEIDEDGAMFSYIWTKMNEDETPDEIWNRNHSYSQKTIRITQDDLFRRATFSCEIEYVGKQA